MTAKIFLKAGAYVLGYLAIWALILFIGIKIIKPAHNDIRIVYFGMSCMVLMFITFLPFLNFVAKRSFHFKGQGTRVSTADLKKTILSTNDSDIPVTVTEKKGRLIVTWKYVDAKWWETMAKAGLTKAYQLHIKFNENKKEATLIDVEKNISW